MKIRLTTAQKTEYKNYLPYFQNGIFHRNDPKKYMDYYLYEIANGTFMASPSTDRVLGQLFTARDQIHEVYRDHVFFLHLCESFMIAHPDSVDSMISYLRAKGIQIYDENYGGVSYGDYSGIDVYIMNHAKGLKEKERCGEEPFVIHSRLALREVCYALEDGYRDFKSKRDPYLFGVEGFRRILTGGKWKDHTLSAIELAAFGDRPAKNIVVSDTCRIIQKATKTDFFHYIKSYYELFPSTKVLLYLIYQYTESFMREFMKQGSKRKRSLKSITSRSLSPCVKEEKEILAIMKEYVTDSRFEEGIKKGVLSYISIHKDKFSKIEERDISFQRNSHKMDSISGKDSVKEDKQGNKGHKRGSRTKAPTLKERMAAMDMGKKPEIRSVQPEKLAMVKSEADAVTAMLHLDEVPYESSENE